MANITQRTDGFIPQYLIERIARAFEEKAVELGPDHPDYAGHINYAAKLRGDQVNTRRRLLLGHLSPLGNTGDGNADRYVFDADGKEEVPTKAVRTEGQPPIKPDVDYVNITYDQSGDVRRYYKDIHNWNSIDGKGMDLHSVTNYGVKYPNAFWDGAEMCYGRGGDGTFRDGGFNEETVSGHEETHGVTGVRNGLEYHDWPGIINEHLSDVGGINVLHYAKSLTPENADNWLLGPNIFEKGVNGRAIRHMLHPGTAYDDWRLGGKDPQPASYKDYKPMDSDNGGVHYYSGIPNRAYAVAAQEIGLPVYEFIAHVWFDAAGMIGSQASLDDLVQATLKACESRNPKHYNSIVHGWNAVDVKAGSIIRRFWVMSGLYKMFA